MNSTLQWSIASTTVMLLCILSYAFADLQTAVWFHHFEHTRMYELFRFITSFGDSSAYLVGGLLLFVLYRNKKPYSAYSGLFLFSTVAASGLAADLVKYIGGRARPILYFNEQLYGFDFFRWEHGWTSFPSGHSATALSAAMLLALLFPRWRLAALIAGFMIAFSRIVLTQHYISDVIAGSFLGIVSTIVLYNHYFATKLNLLKTGNR